MSSVLELNGADVSQLRKGELTREMLASKRPLLLTVRPPVGRPRKPPSDKPFEAGTPSVVLGRHLLKSGMPEPPPPSLVQSLAASGIHRLVVGHTPHGNCPTVIKSEAASEGGPSLEILMCDTSLLGHVHDTSTTCHGRVPPTGATRPTRTCARRTTAAQPSRRCAPRALHLGCTSAAPRPLLGRTSAAPRPHLGRTSAAPRPHLGRTTQGGECERGCGPSSGR